MKATHTVDAWVLRRRIDNMLVTGQAFDNRLPIFFEHLNTAELAARDYDAWEPEMARVTVEYVPRSRSRKKP